jgi:hypothetical protein
MSFYLAFILQMTFVLAYTWDVFNNTVRYSLMMMLIGALPVWVFMFMHMQYEDKKAYDINLIRKSARM